MMLLYDFVRDESAGPGARQVAADELVRLGLLRRERSGPSFAFIWLAAMTAVVVIVGAASILGPAGGVVSAAVAVVLGVLALRRRGEGGTEGVYLGPEGERFSFAPDRRVADGGGASWADVGDSGFGGNGGGGNGGGF